jgi:hypothetical protein
MTARPPNVGSKEGKKTETHRLAEERKTREILVGVAEADLVSVGL